jgi:hypothetical protein
MLPAVVSVVAISGDRGRSVNSVRSGQEKFALGVHQVQVLPHSVDPAVAQFEDENVVIFIVLALVGDRPKDGLDHDPVAFRDDGLDLPRGTRRVQAGGVAKASRNSRTTA